MRFETRENCVLGFQEHRCCFCCYHLLSVPLEGFRVSTRSVSPRGWKFTKRGDYSIFFFVSRELHRPLWFSRGSFAEDGKHGRGFAILVIFFFFVCCVLRIVCTGQSRKRKEKIELR